jgi:hypothetical protein
VLCFWTVSSGPAHVRIPIVFLIMFNGMLICVWSVFALFNHVFGSLCLSLWYSS